MGRTFHNQEDDDPVTSRSVVVLGVFGALSVLLLVAQGATAQSATGTVSGRVLWGQCIRAIPLPMAPDAQVQPPDGRPVPIGGESGLPAGAVLVAVQNTSVSARTDETGRFTLSGVPAGQYLTVAAGPVANSASAIAERPNVFVNGGQSVDLGTLSLGGGPTPFGAPCRVLPGVGAATGTDVPAEPAAPTSP